MEELTGFHSHHEGDVEPLQVFKHRSDKTSILKTLQLAVVQRMDEKGHSGATGH